MSYPEQRLKIMNIQEINRIAEGAGMRIMEIYNEPDYQVVEKEDCSPLTKADLASHHYICSQLKLIDNNIPILSEESAEEINYEERKDWETFWLVDPLDGTKEFIKRNDEFTVNIALIKAGRPVLGVVYAPALDLLYYALDGEGAFRRGSNQRVEKLPCTVFNDEVIRIVASKSHYSPETDEIMQNYVSEGKKIEKVNVGSSLKFCRVAEGSADVYPRLGPTMEWDTAAGHIIAKESKKDVLDYEAGGELEYNKENLSNPWFVVK